MLILGLLIVLGTGAFVGLAIAGNLSGGPNYTVSVLGNDIATMNGLALFCSGLALALIFCLGLVLMTGTAARRHRRHRGTGFRRHRMFGGKAGPEARA
ncbi:hypothetical protein [Streptomyces sp. bgisy153]|uniref:hypothetical protein n=1 Tax=Streptomyces sp. bgisy153 TaxID=3413793 RepID=UPI003D7341B8